MSFDDAVNFVIRENERGYCNDPADPGGATRYGISRRAYPEEDIEHLTLERARFLMRRDYWLPIQGEKLPSGVALALLDFAINSGVHEAVRSLQRILAIHVDGELGAQTLAAIGRVPAKALLEELSAQRLLFMSKLDNWPHERLGWIRRVLRTVLEANS